MSVHVRSACLRHCQKIVRRNYRTMGYIFDSLGHSFLAALFVKCMQAANDQVKTGVTYTLHHASHENLEVLFQVVNTF